MTLPLLTMAACAAGRGNSLIGELPLEIQWNIAQKGSSLSQDFAVRKYRLFDFYLAFKVPPGISAKDLAELQRTFIGTGQKIRVTKDLAGTNHPAVILPPDQEKSQWDGVTSETYVNPTKEIITFWNKDGSVAKREVRILPPYVWEYTKQGAGMVIPVHLRIWEIAAGRAILKFDSVIDTKGQVGAGEGRIRRQITTVPLSPGTYKVEITTANETAVPVGVGTYLLITWNPEITPLDNVQ